MKQKDDKSKWLIPNSSNSSASHAVSRVVRPSNPQERVRPETPPPQTNSTQSHAVSRVDRSGSGSSSPQGYAPPQAASVQSHVVSRVNRGGSAPQGYAPPQQAANVQSHAVSRVDRAGGSSSQGYAPQQAVSAQSHAVMRRRGPAPEITPAPRLPRNAAGDVPQQSLPTGAGHTESHVPERLGRSAPALAPDVPPVTGGSMVPQRIQGQNRPVAESEVSGYVQRIQPEIHPEPYASGNAASNVVRRVRQIPSGNLAETKRSPLLQKPEMEEMPTVGGDTEDDGMNRFADRWSFPED